MPQTAAAVPGSAVAGDDVARGTSAAAGIPFEALGLTVLERGWLSANQALFHRAGATPATVVDTGFSTHAAQTIALIDRVLGPQPLERIVNTHLHSDHCGANHALQRRGTVETWIPTRSFDAVRAWNEDALTYRFTDQPCSPFVADRALMPGQSLSLGAAEWQIHAAPGHDMDAVLLFEPQTRTLISGDALWEDRLAILFPELAGEDGFGPARATLDLIERLRPRTVIPGHGRPFEDVPCALAESRRRLGTFERHPERHANHAVRALLVFHLMAVREAPVETLVAWLLATPIHRVLAGRLGVAPEEMSTWSQGVVQSLVDAGILLEQDARVTVRPQTH